MKSGAGDDPFGDVVSEERADTTDESESAESSAEREDPMDAETETETGVTVDGDADATDIPWVLRRRSVKDDRPNVTQFFLRDETDRAERRFRSEVEERLDTDVYLLDLREAAYVIAMQHPDEVASLLGKWGYDYRD